MLMLLYNEKLTWDWRSLLYTILEEAIKLTSKMREKTDMFERFIAETFSKEEISKIVSVINSNIAISISSGLYSPAVIEHAVRILDFFNLANDMRPHKQRIPYKEFYNDGINNDVNIQSHLKAWIDEREKCKA
jgi:hypothetical protein